MNERIKILTEKTIKGEMWIEHTDTEYDREDIFLSPLTMNAKRTYEYILNQKPFINECTAFTGFLGFRGNVMGDNFNRSGHVNYKEMDRLFYNQPIDSLVTWEFQHSVADFEKVIRIGINGFRQEIQQSMKKHVDADARRSEGQFCKNTVYFARDMPYSCFFSFYAVLRISSINSINSFSSGMSISPTAVK